MHNVEVWICVDADGGYEVGQDADSARERYRENIGNLEETNGFRIVKLLLKVPAESLVVEASLGTGPAIVAPM